MEFKKYQHIERFGYSGVNGIDIGECYIFPKLDGTNGSLWLNDIGFLCAGSRNRELSLINDNAEFFASNCGYNKYLQFLKDNPNLRLFGEWLVPHSLKTYKKDAWNKFYIFDVMNESGDYLHYDVYSKMLDEYGINYIKPLCIIKNPTESQLRNQLKNNTYLIEENSGYGEGIVIKNYSFVNYQGKTKWAKIVSNDFKEKHSESFNTTYKQGQETIEFKIVEKYITLALCEKNFSKIKNETGFSSKNIPQLLNTIFYDLINEDMWDILKRFKNPKIDFNKLKQHTIVKIKEHLPQIF